MLKALFRNAGHPGVNMFGSLMLWMMGHGHQKMQLWTQQFFQIPPDGKVLDIGCGGGRNIDNMRRIAPEATFHGVDCSPLCIKKSGERNRKAVKAGKAFFSLGTVSLLPYEDNAFDLAIASETIYFWPRPADDFKEVYRVLKPSGSFLICNEVAEPKQAEKWVDVVGQMRVYTKKELHGLLTRAGFSDVGIHLHENGHWLCITARKQVENKNFS